MHRATQLVTLLLSILTLINNTYSMLSTTVDEEQPTVVTPATPPRSSTARYNFLLELTPNSRLEAIVSLPGATRNSGLPTVLSRESVANLTSLPTAAKGPVIHAMAEAIRLQEQEEATRLREQEEATRLREQEEATRLLEQEEAAARQREQEEAAARQREQEEAAARQREREEAAARQRAQEEAAARQREQEEAAARLREREEAAARLREQEEAAARLREREEAAARLREREEAAARLREQEEAAARLREQEEAAARLREQEEAAARLREQEETAARLRAQEEATRLREQEEATRLREQEEATRLREQEEAARLSKEARKSETQSASTQKSSFMLRNIQGLAALGIAALLAKLVHHMYFGEDNLLKAIGADLESLNQQHQNIPAILWDLEKALDDEFTQNKSGLQAEAQVISFFERCNFKSLISKLKAIAKKARPQIKEKWNLIYAAHGIIGALQNFSQVLNKVDLPHSSSLGKVKNMLSKLQKHIEDINNACGSVANTQR